MIEVYELGAAPMDEECAQVGEENYAERALKECQCFRRQLLREYQKAHKAELHENAKLCRIKVITKPHDFGYYYEVVVTYKDEDIDSNQAALWFEENIPTNWDEVSKQELH